MFSAYRNWPLHNIRLANMCRGNHDVFLKINPNIYLLLGMDFLREAYSEKEMNSSKSSLAINGNSLCFDPFFVQSLCKILPINLIKTVRYEMYITLL